MPLEHEKSANFTEDPDDKDANVERPAAFEVGGTHAGLIIGLVCGGIFLLLVTVCCLVFKIRRLQKRASSPVVGLHASTGSVTVVGSPLSTVAQGDSPPNDAVVSGRPVIVMATTASDKPP